ncbi:MAG: hypothetical protein NTY98_03240 [Verrucomicrobia bacterium]|nr:hypothetical protein [Verrucomicrobiota bacterium]
MNATTLNEKLNRLNAERSSKSVSDSGARLISAEVITTSAAALSARQGAAQAAPLSVVTQLADDQGGFFARVLAFPFRATQREALSKVMHETRLALMNHRKEAIERESRAIWEASSMKIVAVMAEYLNQHLRDIEQERYDHIMQSSEDAAALLTRHLEKIEASILPDLVKERLLKQALEQYDITIERITDERLALRYANRSGN